MRLLVLTAVGLAAGRSIGLLPTDIQDHNWGGLAMDLLVIGLATFTVIGIRRLTLQVPPWMAGMTVTPAGHASYGVDLACDRCGRFLLPFIHSATLSQLFRYGRQHADHVCSGTPQP